MANLPDLWRDPFSSRRGWTGRDKHSITRLFDEFLDSWNATTWPMASRLASEPVCCLRETDSHYVVSFDVPGMTRNDVKLELEGNSLHLFGSRKEEAERALHSERLYESFDRWITLPGNVKADGIESQLENGILQVAIPKTEVSKAKPIEIADGKSAFFAKQKKEKVDKKSAA